MVEEHNGSDNLACFSYVIDFHDNKDPEAWNRILDAFIDAVEKEGACTGGGMHETSIKNADFCDNCRDLANENNDDAT